MIVVFDLETTGVNPSEDRIVQIGAVKVNETFVESARLVMKINPTVPIPEDATKVHGITDEDVKDCPTFEGAANQVHDFIEGCDLGGYNILAFDIPLLDAEFRRCGMSLSLDGRRLFDAFAIFRKFEKRDLSTAYKLYCHETLTDAHDALADTLATTAILEAQLDCYKDHKETPITTLDDIYKVTLGKRVDIGGKFKWDEEGNACFSFGKLKGMSLEQAKTHEYGYLQWMIGGDFSDDVKGIVRGALKGEYPKKESNG